MKLEGPMIRHIYDNTFMVDSLVLIQHNELWKEIKAFLDIHENDSLSGTGVFAFKEKKSAIEFKLRFCTNDPRY